MLSEAGHEQATVIRELELVLKECCTTFGNYTFARDPEGYALLVFGPVGGEDPWGWRLQGHHLLIDATVVRGRVVFPAAGYLEMANAAASLLGDARVLADVFFVEPLFVEEVPPYRLCGDLAVV